MDDPYRMREPLRLDSLPDETLATSLKFLVGPDVSR
jgi:hypothetical protein